MKIFLIGCLLMLLVHGSAFSQNEELQIYLFKSRYGESAKEYIEVNSIFREIKLLGGYMADPQNKGIIDLKSVKSHLERLYSDYSDTGVLCINIENRIYQDLKLHEKGSREFRKAVKEFTKLISLIRNLRPNVKIGIYGIPFRTYYESQNKWNADCKFDDILSLTDIIFPSLYILYPDKQKGVEENNRYLSGNLATSFDYAERLNKPVIPFVWYIVNPGNQTFGGELLGVNEFCRYVNYIRNFRSSNMNQIRGIVWWESSEAFFDKHIRHVNRVGTKYNRLDNSIILKEYSKPFVFKDE